MEFKKEKTKLEDGRKHLSNLYQSDPQKTMGKELEDMLNLQKDRELKNFTIYTQFSNWYKTKGFVKLAYYFQERASEEMTHHNWIADRLRECNCDYVTPYLSDHSFDCEDMIEPFDTTLSIEMKTTLWINEICDKAIELKDHKIISWLYDKLIPEQHEEESMSLTVLNIAKQEDVDWLTKEEAILNLYKKYKVLPKNSEFYK